MTGSLRRARSATDDRWRTVATASATASRTRRPAPWPSDRRRRGGGPTADWFRGDIDGLRAVAIVAVVAYHANLAGFAGGFVGVDVFFVISGYLITTKLVAESERTGRVGLLAFWAKRLRRLVPAMASMLVAVAGRVGVRPLAPRAPRVAQSGAAASVYVSNILFATGTTTTSGRRRPRTPSCTRGRSASRSSSTWSGRC